MEWEAAKKVIVPAIGAGILLGRVYEDGSWEWLGVTTVKGKIVREK